MIDPTKKDLQACVANFAGEEGFDFDVEVAIYWFASRYHGGQGSDLYSVLSMSDYTPGPLETGPEDQGFAEMLYDEMVAEFDSYATEPAFVFPETEFGAPECGDNEFDTV